MRQGSEIRKARWLHFVRAHPSKKKAKDGAPIEFVLDWFLETGGVGHLAGAQAEVKLLVESDIDCNWKLDGQPMSPLKADDSRVVPVSPGEHRIRAATTDGVNKNRQVAHSSRYQELCPVHRSPIAMSGSSGKVPAELHSPELGKSGTGRILLAMPAEQLQPLRSRIRGVVEVETEWTARIGGPLIAIKPQ